jgi:hypothetical protein
MPNPNAVVSHIIRFEPTIDRPHAEILRGERGLAVELEGGRRARFDPADPKSVGLAQILDGLRGQGLPVYLEIDPATSAITRLLIPHVAHVIGLRPIDTGEIGVELDVSHARHVLRRGSPDAAELEKRLREALASGTPVILTEDDAHEVLDVRGYTPSPEGPLRPFPPFPVREFPPRLPSPWRWFRDLWWWLWRLPWWWFRCTSMTKAQQIFNTMAATSCNPLTVPPPCIPFLYPDDGCWARAHEMCRLMINLGLSPRKVWIDHSPGHSLHVSTKNNPQCYVEWGWHVAPTLCVRGSKWPQTQPMVIDPSLFTTPVSEATWKGVQGDPGATLTPTDASVFWHGGGTDPTYSASNAILAQYRLALQARSIQVGPPPYANCP